MVQLSGRVLKTVLLCVFILVGINGCKDDYTSIIPYVYVDMNIPSANFIEFNVPGGSVYFKNVGYGGIIVFRDMTVDNSISFLAFDATCPYEYGLTATREIVTADGSGLATCPKCGSQFVLFGGAGSVAKGPAAEPLKQYRTSYLDGRIIIRN